jgi:hypothetical protein
VAGVNLKTLPVGEQQQRILADKFSEAYKAKEAGDPKALATFFNDHPEYEARLALFKSPEERLKTFMTDNVWTAYNNMPEVNRKEVADQLGSDFQQKFLDKETRNYDSLSPLQLQVWLKLMNGKQVGALSASDEVMAELNHLKLTDPSTAWRVQTFYDMRNQFQNWNTLQNKYFSLSTTEQKKAFMAQNPELKQYWDSRRSWMNKNPDLVRFLTDDPKQLKQYENKNRNPQVAEPTAQEIRSKISQPTMELLAQWQQGANLPPSVQQYVSLLAKSYGMDSRTLLGIITGR